jgi:hypothetical protein
MTTHAPAQPGSIATQTRDQFLTAISDSPVVVEELEFRWAQRKPLDPGIWQAKRQVTFCLKNILSQPAFVELEISHQRPNGTIVSIENRTNVMPPGVSVWFDVGMREEGQHKFLSRFAVTDYDHAVLYSRDVNFPLGSGGEWRSRRLCFVATACFESVDAPEVALLRAYRDKVLRRGRAGRLTIAGYERVGPRLAAMALRSAILRRAGRFVLRPLAHRLARWYGLR